MERPESARCSRVSATRAGQEPCSRGLDRPRSRVRHDEQRGEARESRRARHANSRESACCDVCRRPALESVRAARSRAGRDETKRNGAEATWHLARRRLSASAARSASISLAIPWRSERDGARAMRACLRPNFPRQSSRYTYRLVYFSRHECHDAPIVARFLSALNNESRLFLASHRECKMID